MKNKPHKCNMCRGLKSVTCRLSGCRFNLCESIWAQVSWFCRFPCGVLDPCGSYNPSTLSSAGLPKLSLMFSCGSLLLFLSVAGWILSDDSYVRLLSASIAEYYKCQGWALFHSMSPKLGQSLVSFSRNFCSILMPAPFLGRKNYELKVLWVGWCHKPLIGRFFFPIYWRSPFKILYSPLLGVLARSAIIDFWEFPLP